MKKANFLSILVLFSMLFLVSSCNKDDDDATSGNSFTLNGETITLSKGFISNFGSNGNGSFDWDVTLTSNGISYNGTELTGTGDIVYLDLNTGDENGLTPGTYNWSLTRAPSTIVDGSAIGQNFNISSTSGNLFTVTGGTVEVSISNNETSFDFNLNISGSTVTGSFTGVLQEIQ